MYQYSLRAQIYGEMLICHASLYEINDMKYQDFNFFSEWKLGVYDTRSTPYILLILCSIS